ncbi:MAG: hypothetical protein LIO85_01355 [Rikenellaceae bacterium]|nr:hypothetical protein [Rikenellaceae bacterium]
MKKAILFVVFSLLASQLRGQELSDLIEIMRLGTDDAVARIEAMGYTLDTENSGEEQKLFVNVMTGETIRFDQNWRQSMWFAGEPTLTFSTRRFEDRREMYDLTASLGFSIEEINSFGDEVKYFRPTDEVYFLYMDHTVRGRGEEQKVEIKLYLAEGAVFSWVYSAPAEYDSQYLRWATNLHDVKTRYDLPEKFELWGYENIAQSGGVVYYMNGEKDVVGIETDEEGKYADRSYVLIRTVSDDPLAEAGRFLEHNHYEPDPPAAAVKKPKRVAPPSVYRSKNLSTISATIMPVPDELKEVAPDGVIVMWEFMRP